MEGTLTGRCESCKEHHPKHCMCPPHEVRTTGQAWFRIYIDELEGALERLRALVGDLAKAHAGGGFVELDGDLARELSETAEGYN